MREKWRRTRVWITNRGPVRCTPSIEEAIQIPHIAKGRAATLLERIYGQYISEHIRLLSHIRSVRFDERSYWSLTTPVGRAGLIYIFSFTAYLKKNNIYMSILLMRLLLTSKKGEKSSDLLCSVLFNFFYFFYFFAWCAALIRNSSIRPESLSSFDSLFEINT
jgi:hypothetical protein